MRAFAIVAAVISMAMPAVAQGVRTAPDEPLFQVATAADSVTMRGAVSGAGSLKHAWVWTFYSGPRGSVGYDTTAQYVRFDCTARSKATMQIEVFAEGRVLGAQTASSLSFERPPAGSLAEAIVRHGCDGLAGERVGSTALGRTRATGILSSGR